MTAFDGERVERLVSAIRNSLRLLRDLSRMNEADFNGDEHKQSSAKYNFVSGIEAAIDLANHLISTRRLRAPEDYADTFQVLCEAGVFRPDFTAELKKMARFRNRLVHRYWEVDTGELWRILQTRLGDFDAYVENVVRYLETESKGS
jgi:uncharacterized protein YutE (UPF0331/DUF86 family)